MLTATIPSTPITTVGSPTGRYLTNWVYGPASGYSRIYNSCTNANRTLQGKITLPLEGSSIDGYPIYTTNVPGIGVVFKGRSRDADPGAPLQSDWVDIITGVTDYWDASFGVRLVSTRKTIVSGTVTLPGVIGQLKVVDKADLAGSSTIIPINLMVAGSATFTSRTCSVSTGSQNFSVPLAKINSTAFGNIGSTAGSANFNIQLEGCSTGLKVYMTFSDNNNAANTSDVLSLTPGPQSASGVGIRINYNSQPVRFGVDSAVAGNPNQISIATTSGAMMNIPFTAGYVRTGTIIGGEVKGVATFTMSYQ
ncbi:type 1 fimbrial protein [Pseudomonas sp. PDNC002]|uniref:fimbrial protein n=1 Tax=Pseudomonas sp. PDNC002 TaxID=2811422 RepID=UPI0019626595|nr:fimbrial protein [Pseudomonas sp. PDNC002]QRY77822.1 type 1 fimbrial protein [Pseudomonas sp. PDNC002]